MATNMRIYMFSELQSKATRLRSYVDVKGYYFRVDAYFRIVDVFLVRATAGDNFGSFHPAVAQGLQPKDNKPRQPLDIETLTQLDLNKPRTSKDIHVHGWGLTLKDNYDLGASGCHIRKALLGWGIVSGCTGLVEDLWNSEQGLDLADSAFSGGPDELLYSIVCTRYKTDTVSPLLFLLDVVRVSATEKFREDGQ
ncbi:hypothetical protein ACLX1H_005519 [Fusarium chlamydosporum]